MLRATETLEGYTPAILHEINPCSNGDCLSSALERLSHGGAINFGGAIAHAGADVISCARGTRLPRRGPRLPGAMAGHVRPRLFSWPQRTGVLRAARGRLPDR